MHERAYRIHSRVRLDGNGSRNTDEAHRRDTHRGTTAGVVGEPRSGSAETSSLVKTRSRLRTGRHRFGLPTVRAPRVTEDSTEAQRLGREVGLGETHVLPVSLAGRPGPVEVALGRRLETPVGRLTLHSPQRTPESPHSPRPRRVVQGCLRAPERPRQTPDFPLRSVCDMVNHRVAPSTRTSYTKRPAGPESGTRRRRSEVYSVPLLATHMLPAFPSYSCSTRDTHPSATPSRRSNHEGACTNACE